MTAFLSDDYLTKVEDKLQMMVQQTNQRLRDFAYDYRALCMKWKPAISEEKVVNCILNNINPRVAGCLRGTVNTVEHLVKVGSHVEKYCMGVKDCWQKVGNMSNRDKPKKQIERSYKQEPGWNDSHLTPFGHFPLAGASKSKWTGDQCCD